MEYGLPFHTYSPPPRQLHHFLLLPLLRPALSPVILTAFRHGLMLLANSSSSSSHPSCSFHLVPHSSLPYIITYIRVFLFLNFLLPSSISSVSDSSLFSFLSLRASSFVQSSPINASSFFLFTSASPSSYIFSYIPTSLVLSPLYSFLRLTSPLPIHSSSFISIFCFSPSYPLPSHSSPSSRSSVSLTNFHNSSY